MFYSCIQCISQPICPLSVVLGSFWLDFDAFIQQNMHFQGLHFFPLLQFEQPPVLRPPIDLNLNIVWIIKSAQNKFNGCSLMYFYNNHIFSTITVMFFKSFPTVVSDWISFNFWLRYGHFSTFHKHVCNFVKNCPIFKRKPPLESWESLLSAYLN